MELMRSLARRRFFKVAVVLAMVFLFLYIVPVPSVGEPVEALAHDLGRFIEVSGIKIHYVEVRGGGNTTFVLLHGFGASVFSWREIVSWLSSYGRVIAFDRPGFGLSERVDPSRAEVNPYTAEGQVELTYNLFLKLGIDRAVLVGHSAGGGVALLFALEHPELVEALILIAPAWRYSQRNPLETLLYNIPLADKYGPLLLRGFVGQLEQILYRAWYNKSKITGYVLEGYRYPLKARDWDKGLYWLMKYRGFPDISNRLDNLRIPILIVHGRNDEIVHLSSSIELVELLDTAPYRRLIVINECGHLPHEEKPAEFIQTIQEFIANLPYRYLSV